MSTASQSGFLLQLIIGLYDDLARNEPQRLRIIDGRLRLLLAAEDDAGTRKEIEGALSVLAGFIADLPDG